MRKPVEVAAVVAFAIALFGDLLAGAPALAPTHDELANIPSGVAQIRLGTPSDFTHPPLARYLTALPLLALGVDPIDTPEGRTALERWKWKDYGRLFVFHNPRLAPETIVLVARIPVMLMTVALALFCWRWSRSRWGPLAGLVTFGAFAFSPTILAHGRLCTPDVPSALVAVLAVLALGRSLRLRTPRSEILAGIAMGAAFLVKYTAIALVPTALVLWLVAWLRERWAGRPAPLSRLVARPAAVVALVAALTVWAGFSFQVKRIADEPLVNNNPVAQKIVAAADAKLRPWGLSAEGVMAVPLPAYDFWKGLGTQIAHNFLQNLWMHDSYQYLWGRYNQTGWWWYFPMAFLWKTALPILLASAVVWLLAGRAMAARVRGSAGLRAAIAHGALEPWVLAVFPVVYALFCLTSTINVGHRYLLPIYPFLLVGLGRLATWDGLRRRGPRIAAAALSAWLVVGSLRVFPDHLSYFNELAGGAKSGWRLLADSNVDWGQDLWRLRAALARIPGERYFLDVYSSARPVEDYGLPRPTPYPASLEDGRPSGLVIVSVNRLHFKGERDVEPRYAWLRPGEPFARIGDSIFAYWIEGGRPVAPPAGHAVWALADQ